MGIVVHLSNVRLSYPKLGEPEYYKGVKQRPDDKRRWSAGFHVGPESTAQRVEGGKLVGSKLPAKAFIDAAWKELAATTWEKKGELKLANILPDPKACSWQDGARKEVPGVWILSTHRTEDKGRPLVLDNDKSPIYKPNGEIYEGKSGRIYSGMYVNAQVELWAQKAPNEGFRGALLIIQRYREGAAFSGGAAPNADVMPEVADGSDAEDMA
jgi:hypothetical protein